MILLQKLEKKVFSMIRLVHMLPLLLIFSDSCVEPLTVDFPDIPPRLVVDGLVTDQPGPYQVRLFYTTRLDSTLKRPRYETNAFVYINDELGNSEPLFEVSPGVYQTDSLSSFQGVVGKSYWLQIFTENGKAYETEPQKMLPAGSLDDVRLEFVPDAVESGEPLDPVFDAFTIRVDAHGDDESNLFRWRWIGTYKFRSFPELRIEGGINGPIPDPEPCSGYIKVNNDSIRQIAPCTCCICWATEYSSNAVVTDNRYIGDYTFSNVQLGYLPVTTLNFLEKYYLEVEQLSVSEQVYEFWRLMGMQQNSGGNIFQPNSIKIRGNVTCVSDPDEEVLGSFSVSAVVRRTMYVYPEDIPGFPGSLPEQKVVTTSCLNFENSTTTQPSFW